MLSHPPIQVNDLADHIDDLKVQYSSDHSPGSGFIYMVLVIATMVVMISDNIRLVNISKHRAIIQ